MIKALIYIHLHSRREITFFQSCFYLLSYSTASVSIDWIMYIYLRSGGYTGHVRHGSIHVEVGSIWRSFAQGFLHVLRVLAC